MSDPVVCSTLLDDPRIGFLSAFTDESVIIQDFMGKQLTPYKYKQVKA